MTGAIRAPMSRGGVFDIALEGDQLDTPLGRKILTESLSNLYQIIADCRQLMRICAKRVIYDAIGRHQIKPLEVKFAAQISGGSKFPPPANSQTSEFACLPAR